MLELIKSQPRCNMRIDNVRTAARLAVHDFRVRYARSALGPIWLLMTPAALLGVYGLVFGIVLKVRWPAVDEGTPVGFLVPFFCGLSVFLFFSDIVGSSTGLFVSKRSYVRKSPFPLWVLWLANFLRACIQGSAYLFILVIIAAASNILKPIGLVFGLVATAEILISCAALSLILASIGPFLGDLSEGVRVSLRLLFYSAPVAYPLAVVPSEYQFILWLNPLTHMIEALRGAVVYNGLLPMHFLLFAIVGIYLLAASWWLFSRVSEAIPDVV